MINDKTSLYGGLLRNHLFCPKLKEQMMTTDFMKGVIGYKRYWLPRCQEIRLKNCVDPPPRHELAQMVYDKMMESEPTGTEPFDSSFKRTASVILRKPPKQDWLVAMLATMDPNNRIFDKDYVRPKGKLVEEEEDDADMIDNSDGFFDGLPLAKPSKRAPIRFRDEVAHEDQKLKRMQMQHAIMQSRLDDQMEKVGYLHEYQQVAGGPPSFAEHVQRVKKEQMIHRKARQSIASDQENADPNVASRRQSQQQQPKPVIHTSQVGPNVIGNVEDMQAESLDRSFIDVGNTEMRAESSSVPQSLNPAKGSIKTRKEKKQNQLMREAEKRTQE